MKRGLLVAAIFVAASVAVAALCARGSVGPGSVAHIEVRALLEEAANAAEANITSVSRARPSSVPLPWRVEAKRVLKAGFGAVGIAMQVPEVAEAFVVEQQKTKSSLRCIVRIRGDHVIGLVLEPNDQGGSFLLQFQRALQERFRGYAVLISAGA